MIDEMGEPCRGAAGKQRFAERIECPNFVGTENLKRHVLLPRFLRCKLHLAAAYSECQQTDAAIANKCTS